MSGPQAARGKLPLTGSFDAVARSQAVGAGGDAGGAVDRAGLATLVRSRLLAGDVDVSGARLRLEPLSPSIGTVVHGADLAKPMGAELLGFLRRLWLDRRVIMFRGQQHLTHDDHERLAAQFGVIGAHHGERDWVPENQFVRNTPENDSGATLRGHPDIIKIWSVERAPAAAQNWHSDVMWSTRPPMGSMLLAREVPPVGGDTCFCDSYAMWQGLSPATRGRLEGLRALNVGGQVHAKGGVIPQAVHPCARTHPETGGTTLYVAPGFTRKILDVPEEESQRLLRACFAQAGKPEFSCRFRWEPGSLAFWDNRACFHYATPDFWPYTRKLQRVTVLDREEAAKVPSYRPPGHSSRL